MRSFLLVSALATAVMLSCNHSEPSRSTDLSAAETPRDTAVEFGHVRWNRRLEPALAQAARSERPVMLFFQEVPG